VAAARRPRKEHLFQLAANIYLYATDKRSDARKGDTHVVKDAGHKPERTVVVARLEAGTNWDPEPGGWRRLATVLNNGWKVGLDVRPVKLGAGKLSSAGAAVAHLTGTGAFKLDAKQAEELKAFVAGGGTLVVDAAGGSSEFAEAVEKQVPPLFGDAVAQQLARPLPIEHPLFSNPAAPIARVAYRRAATERITGQLKGPRLRGAAVSGKRLGLIMSREDLSTGLVGHPVDGVIGYDPGQRDGDHAQRGPRRRRRHRRPAGAPSPAAQAPPAAQPPAAPPAAGDSDGLE
jgi:hypothetical protein